MGTPGVQVSPWSAAFPDYQGNAITVTVTFNNSTKALSGATVVRDVGCVYTFLAFGLGPDGTPNTAPARFNVPVGTTNVTANQLKAGGLNTINDVLALQITAGQ